MKVLVLADDGFVVPHVITYLTKWGHEVSLLRIKGDVTALSDIRSNLMNISPDVVIDVALISLDDVKELIDLVDGSETRVVLGSSFNAYRAYARFDRSEPGAPDLVPLIEDDPLRDPSSIPGGLRNNAAIERLLSDANRVNSTTLRLPTVYGPNDPQRNFSEYVAQMDSGSLEIDLAPEFAEWRTASGYVEDVAYAIALAAKNSKAAGKTYNIADSFAFTRADWIRAIGRAAGWQGIVRVDETNPTDSDHDYNQHLIVDSSKIRQDLGYIEQVPINVAFSNTVSWERSLIDRK